MIMVVCGGSRKGMSMIVFEESNEVKWAENVGM